MVATSKASGFADAPEEGVGAVGDWLVCANKIGELRRNDPAMAGSIRLNIMRMILGVTDG